MSHAFHTWLKQSPVIYTKAGLCSWRNFVINCWPVTQYILWVVILYVVWLSSGSIWYTFHTFMILHLFKYNLTRISRICTNAYWSILFKLDEKLLFTSLKWVFFNETAGLMVIRGLSIQIDEIRFFKVPFNLHITELMLPPNWSPNFW